MKVIIEEKSAKPTYEIGKCVKFDEGNGLFIVLIDGVVSNKSFSGTVVFCNTSEYVVGHRSSNWTKEMFQPFYGTILMEM